MYVDEAHEFKNLFIYTSMRNVAGIQTQHSQKASDMYMKCRILQEIMVVSVLRLVHQLQIQWLCARKGL